MWLGACAPSLSSPGSQPSEVILRMRKGCQYWPHFHSYNTHYLKNCGHAWSLQDLPSRVLGELRVSSESSEPQQQDDVMRYVTWVLLPPGTVFTVPVTSNCLPRQRSCSQAEEGQGWWAEIQAEIKAPRQLCCFQNVKHGVDSGFHSLHFWINSVREMVKWRNGNKSSVQDLWVGSYFLLSH